MKQFLKSVLSDKSFWAALVSLITCVCVALNVRSGSIAQITSFVSGIGTIIAYIISNGVQVAAKSKADATLEAAKIAAGK